MGNNFMEVDDVEEPVDEESSDNEDTDTKVIRKLKVQYVCVVHVR